MSESKFIKMVNEVLGFETVSIARVQRVFSIGYARATSVIDELEAKGLLVIHDEKLKKYNPEKEDEIKKVFLENLSFLLKNKK